MATATDVYPPIGLYSPPAGVALHQIARMTPGELKAMERFEFVPGPSEPTATGGMGRIEIFEPPMPVEERPVYVLGGDTALGISGRDCDAAVVLCKGPGPIRQVAEAHGYWGETFDRVIYALARYYVDAFVLIERQTLGLVIMQRLLIDYEYPYLYHERKQEDHRRPVSTLLGHPASNNDMVLYNFRRAVLDGSVLIRSRVLLEQMGKLQFRESTPSPDGTRRSDEDLKVRLAGGGSPDLVMAAAYSWLANQQVIHFPREVDPFPPGSLGDILGHRDTHTTGKPGNVWAGRVGKRRI